MELQERPAMTNGGLGREEATLQRGVACQGQKLPFASLINLVGLLFIMFFLLFFVTVTVTVLLCCNCLQFCVKVTVRRRMSQTGVRCRSRDAVN